MFSNLFWIFYAKLTHPGRDQKAAIVLTTFTNWLSERKRMKTVHRGRGTCYRVSRDDTKRFARVCITIEIFSELGSGGCSCYAIVALSTWWDVLNEALYSSQKRCDLLITHQLLNYQSILSTEISHTHSYIRAWINKMYPKQYTDTISNTCLHLISV